MDRMSPTDPTAPMSSPEMRSDEQRQIDSRLLRDRSLVPRGPFEMQATQEIVKRHLEAGKSLYVALRGIC